MGNGRGRGGAGGQALPLISAAASVQPMCRTYYPKYVAIFGGRGKEVPVRVVGHPSEHTIGDQARRFAQYSPICGLREIRRAMYGHGSRATPAPVFRRRSCALCEGLSGSCIPQMQIFKRKTGKYCSRLSQIFGHFPVSKCAPLTSPKGGSKRGAGGRFQNDSLFSISSGDFFSICHLPNARSS